MRRKCFNQVSLANLPARRSFIYRRLTLIKNSRQGVPRFAIRCLRAGRNVANFLESINSTILTGWNLSCAGQLDVGREVIWKMDGRACLQLMFQGKLVCGGINLAKIVETGVRGGLRPSLDKIWKHNENKKAKRQDCYGYE
jgi:hypothetical protein